MHSLPQNAMGHCLDLLKTECTSRTLPRRGFLLAGIWGFISAALALPAALYVGRAPRSNSSAGWTPAGELSALPLNVPRHVTFERTRVDGWSKETEKADAWVVRKSEAAAVAFVPLCTHLGCAVRWQQDRQNFLCPCHVSTFDIEGRVLSGPAPRPLDRYAVKVEDGRILLGPVESA